MTELSPAALAAIEAAGLTAIPGRRGV